MSIADTHEPAPVPNERRAVWSLVIADMQERDSEGRRKYGTPLQPFNGRDALIDAYQEALDLVVYLRQAIAERDADPVTCDYCCGPATVPTLLCSSCDRRADAALYPGLPDRPAAPAEKKGGE